MKAILGRKIGMSQTFSPTGEVVPVTLIAALPNKVAIRRTTDKDGYTAVQLALPKTPRRQGSAGQANEVELDGEQGAPRRSPEASSAGHTSDNKKIKYVARMEFHGEMAADATTATVEQFVPGDVVEVIGTSKGKGFQGVVKRHKFKGGPASHGHTDWERKAGSIGSRFPQHVRKGKRMPGRMGSDRVTVKNLQIVVVDAAKQLLAVKGAVPGPKGAIVAVQLLDETK